MSNNAFVTALTGAVGDLEGAIWSVAAAAAAVLIAMVLIKVAKKAFSKLT